MLLKYSIPFLFILAAFGALFLSLGIARSLTVFFEPLRERFHVSKSAITVLALVFACLAHGLGTYLFLLIGGICVDSVEFLGRFIKFPTNI